MTECPICGYDIGACEDCARMDSAKGGRIRRWFCRQFGWHKKLWVSPADCFDTCLSCGERFPHSPALSSETFKMTTPSRETIAILLWHRFAPESHEEWAQETHKAEYLDAADAVLFRIFGPTLSP